VRSNEGGRFEKILLEPAYLSQEVAKASPIENLLGRDIHCFFSLQLAIQKSMDICEAF